MTDGRDERAPREILADIPLAVRSLKERCEVEDRGAEEWEIAELDRFARSTVAAARAAYHKETFFYRYNPPKLDEEWWDATKAKLRKPPPGAPFRARLTALPSASNPERGKPRHREADAFPVMVIEQLGERLAARKAAIDAGRMRDDKLTHEAIAEHLTGATDFEFTRSRVQRAEQVRNMALEVKGWDLQALLRSHPEFRADNGTWRLPTPKKARQILGLPASQL